MPTRNVKFKQWNCVVEKRKYENGRPAIVLNDKETQQRIAIATINIPEINLLPDEVLIKDYSENEGMMDILTKAEIIKPTTKTVLTGFVTATIAKVLI